MGQPVRVKTCGKCKQELSAEYFHKDKRRSHGLQARCKQCQKEDAYAWRARNPEKVKEKSARYYERRGAAYLREYRYGLSEEVHASLLDSQGGVCAICHTHRGETLHVDHDHQTGAVRGLLCRLCNTAIGKFNDDPSRLRAAAAYLERPTS